jgi:hypothetical protein
MPTLRSAPKLAPFLLFALAMVPALSAQGSDENVVQAQRVLTVSEGKRLIARAIVQMPVVQQALKNGLVIVCKGTTTTYVARELLNADIPHGAFLIGRVYPEKGGKRLKPTPGIDEIILINGKRQNDLSLAEAVKRLKAGDVVIKGANALNYERKLAAGLLGVPNPGAGTSGKIIPAIIGTKAHLIIPVGLEKEIGSNIVEVVKAMQTPTTTLGNDLSMVLFTGDIVTEIEALQTLAGVSVLHVASGGIGGAEGSIRLLLRGSKQQVEKALKVIDDVQGEPPFVP